MMPFYILFFFEKIEDVLTPTTDEHFVFIDILEIVV
jgi:hypothetical protein